MRTGDLVATLALVLIVAIAMIALARRKQRMEDGRNRAHAAGGDDRAGAAVEVGERTCQNVARRIAAARVIVARLFIEAGEAEGRGQSDPHVWHG